MPLLRKEDQERFIEVLHQDMMNVNLIEASKKAKMDFFEDVQPTIDYDLSFYERIQQFLVAVKYNLVQRIIDENDNKSVTCAKALIDFIENGVLLKRNVKTNQQKTITETHPSLRKALGLEASVAKIKPPKYTDPQSSAPEVIAANKIRISGKVNDMTKGKKRGRPKGTKNFKTVRVDLLVPGRDGTNPGDDFSPKSGSNDLTSQASNVTNDEDLDNEPF